MLGSVAIMEGKDQKNEIHCPHKEAVYYDRYGRKLFGTSQPSAFAVAHPWPPIPTNLGKKRVLRRTSAEETGSSGGKNSEDGLEGVVYVPKNCSDIELALYWDRVPRVERLTSLTCPVHGEVRQGRSVTFGRLKRPGSLPPLRQDRSNGFWPANETHHPPVKGVGCDKERVQIKDHETIQAKLADIPPRSDDAQPESSEFLRETDTPPDQAKKEDKKDLDKDKGAENNRGTTATAKAPELEESTRTEQCTTMTAPPVKVVRTRSRTADKQVQIPDQDFYCLMMSRPTYFCPLHGSYLNGIRRRNTPRFRTILLKDEQNQADLQIKPSPCGKEHRDDQHSSSVDVEKARKIGNLYSKKNASKHRRSSARRDKDLTEYEIHFKNPKSVAESNRLNSVPSVEESKRCVRARSSYLKR